MTVWHKTPEYMLISNYYGDKKAERSGVPLMNHIREGIKLLIQWDRPEIEQRAFALHPLIQNGINMAYRSVAPSDSRPITDEVLKLAEEYARVANSYLCKPETDELTFSGDIFEAHKIVGPMTEHCAWMLLADKVQNEKDFRLYHWFNHERAYHLGKYFSLWIEMLRIIYCK